MMQTLAKIYNFLFLKDINKDLKNINNYIYYFNLGIISSFSILIFGLSTNKSILFFSIIVLVCLAYSTLVSHFILWMLKFVISHDENKKEIASLAQDNKNNALGISQKEISKELKTTFEQVKEKEKTNKNDGKAIRKKKNLSNTKSKRKTNQNVKKQLKIKKKKKKK